MTNLPEKQQIKEAINVYCQAKQLSKKEFATQVGVSDATLSKIETGKWDDITEKMWRKIWNKVRDINTSGHFNTADFEICTKVCDAARQHQFMIGLIADTGMGKTTALTAYAYNPNVFYVYYEKSWQPKHFFIALLREMGISFTGNINKMLHRIADELNALDSPLVIIDEAGKLTHTMLLYLQVLRDKTCKNCGYVLAGMPYFKSNLIKFADKQKEGYAEFLRRINLWQTLEGLSLSEITYICEQYGITDPETLKDMKRKKRFGDLYNAILLHQIENSEAV